MSFPERQETDCNHTFPPSWPESPGPPFAVYGSLLLSAVALKENGLGTYPQLDYHIAFFIPTIRFSYCIFNTYNKKINSKSCEKSKSIQ